MQQFYRVNKAFDSLSQHNPHKLLIRSKISTKNSISGYIWRMNKSKVRAAWTPNGHLVKRENIYYLPHG